jgi:hypothetical protein
LKESGSAIFTSGWKSRVVGYGEKTANLIRRDDRWALKVAANNNHHGALTNGQSDTPCGVFAKGLRKSRLLTHLAID